MNREEHYRLRACAMGAGLVLYVIAVFRYWPGVTPVILLKCLLK